MKNDSAKKETISVSQLNRSARRLLEMHFQQVWVEGEISNFACPSSGHWYFSLKDDKAQVRCAMFRGQNFKVGFVPEAGMQIRVRAKLSLYEGRGDYQLIVEHLEEAGTGALQQAFEQLKQRLTAEGLFEQSHKQELPAYPDHIGIISSPTGAALHDILHVLKRRYPAAVVTLIPTAVQGKEAPAQIISAIQNANKTNRSNKINKFDVIIVGRGGGSLEDLWAFNDEGVARAIFASTVPVISAVGHEIDFSISDFVADVRAPTPSAAAEICTPEQHTINDVLQQYFDYFVSHIEYQIEAQQQELRFLNQQLKHPGQVLHEQAQHIDHLELRLQQSMQNQLQKYQYALKQNVISLKHFSPEKTLVTLQQRIKNSLKALQQANKQNLKNKQQQLQHCSQLLNNLSPLQVLNRGYAILQQQNGQIVRDEKQVEEGEELKTRLNQGSLVLRVVG